jgi:putative ABC transport system substrate-binding protein
VTLSKRVINLALVAMLFALTFPAEAQQAKKIPKIGLLSASTPSAIAASIEAFQQGLRDLGYFEGKNIVIEFRYGEGKLDRIVPLAVELVGSKVDVIVTNGPTDTRAAKYATTTLPIIMAQDSDPVGSGFVASLARPGGNITGLSTLSPELSGKQLELLKEIVPKLARVAILGNLSEPGNSQAVKETELAAGALAIQLQYVDVQQPSDIDIAFSAVKKERAGAFVVLRNPVASAHRKKVVALATMSQVPGMYVRSEWVEAGGFVSYAPDIRDNWRRAATYVDRILKGAKPADLPVEQPTKFELVINLKTAKQIGLTIPPQVLARADRVIK